MSLQADLIFQQETDILTTNWEKLKENVAAYRNFVFSPKFLHSPKEFLQKLGDFQINLITFMGTYMPFANPIAQQPSAHLSEEEEEEEEEEGSSKMSYVKVLIAVAAMITGYAAVEKGWLTINVFYWLLAVTVGLTLLPSALTAIWRLWKNWASRRQKEEEETLTNPREVERWIYKSLKRMRERYLAIRKLTLYQNQPEMEEYKRLGVHAEVYRREEKENVDLAAEFDGIIGEIVNLCNNNIWERRTTIIAAIVQSKAQQYPKV